MADKALDRSGQSLDQSLHDHLWGYRDTRFRLNERGVVELTGSRYDMSGTEMPLFWPFVQDILGHEIDPADLKSPNAAPAVPAPLPCPEFRRAVETALATDRVSDDAKVRLNHSHGQTSNWELYQVIYENLERVADLVVWPESTEDAEQLIRLAAEHGVCLVPYGGGTNVSNALLLSPAETRPIVSVDMGRMNRLLSIDGTNQTARVQAGITGSELERALRAEGWVMGHEPDSMELSTLGGWISTNASGMKKNRYGNIEQIVEKVTLISPRGEVTHHDSAPRRSAGIQPRDLVFGSEGNLGLITEAVVNIHRIPEETRYASYVFPDFARGVDFMLRLQRSGTVPASVRLVDNLQFRFSQALKPEATGLKAVEQTIQRTALEKLYRFDLRDISAATVVMEGSRSEVSHQARHIKSLAKSFRGVAGGAENGKRGYMLTYAIAYIRDFLAPYYISGETYETSTTWDNIHHVVDAVKQAALDLHARHNLYGNPFISARITQVYHSGVCIYFTHGFSNRGLANPLDVFIDVEHGIREAILAAGGSISHHHGVGKLRQHYLDRVMTPTSRAMLKELKNSADPGNVFGIGNGVFG